MNKKTLVILCLVFVCGAVFTVLAQNQLRLREISRHRRLMIRGMAATWSVRETSWMSASLARLT